MAATVKTTVRRISSGAFAFYLTAKLFPRKEESISAVLRSKIEDKPEVSLPVKRESELRSKIEDKPEVSLPVKRESELRSKIEDKPEDSLLVRRESKLKWKIEDKRNVVPEDSLRKKVESDLKSKVEDTVPVVPEGIVPQPKKSEFILRSFFQIFSTDNYNTASMEKKTTKNAFKCPVCGSGCGSAGELTKHYRKHSSMFDSKKSKVENCKCGAKFPSKDNYKEHKNSGECPLLPGESLTQMKKRKVIEARARARARD